MKTTLRTGIVGMGFMGTSHARQISEGKIPGMILSAVCDQADERLAPWCAAGVGAFTDFKAFLSSGLDAVVIATPHYSHTEYGIAALDAGLHVLVEKPISVHKADAERLIAAHRSKTQVFAAMFNQRTDPSYVKLKRLIDTGELGAIQRISWIITDWFRTHAYYKSGGWRATWAGEGGGVLVNQCPHQLDLYQWLFGMPKNVRAFCQMGRFHDIEVEDSVTAFMEHTDGATGVFVTTTGEAPGTNRLEVAGDRGKVVIENGRFDFTRNEIPSAEFSRIAKGGFDKPETWNITIPISGTGEQHAGILKNFAAACLDGAALIAPAAEGLRSVELANAMLLSSSSESTIALPMNAETYSAWLQNKIDSSRARKN